MILLPALISLPILYYYGLDEIYWRDLPSQTATLATIGLVLWTIFGIYKAIELREEVREILVRLEELLVQIKSIFKGIYDPSNMSELTWVLEKAVVIRKKMDSAKSWARRKIPSTIEQNILPFLGSLGEAITEFISQEGRKVTEKIQEITSSTADWATEKFNQELDRLFHSYIEKSNMVETARVIAFSAFPSIWLALISWQSGVGF
jgi:sugar-specific transcriptional regulator TrmB